MNTLSGDKVVGGSVSFVPQEAWVISATLRDNVLLGADFDYQNYEQAIEASALIQVMNILSYHSY